MVRLLLHLFSRLGPNSGETSFMAARPGKKIILFLGLLFLFTIPAQAQETIEFYGGRPEYQTSASSLLSFFNANPRDFVPVVPQAFCLHFLGETVAKQKIGAGLEAIESIQASATSLGENLSCLEGVVRDWTSLFPRTLTTTKSKPRIYGSTSATEAPWRADPPKFLAKVTHGSVTVTTELDPSHAEWAQEYKSRRLLASFAAHIKQGGKVDDTEGVCRKFEQQQEANRAYAKTLVLKPIAWHGVHWKLATEIGLSEAEFMAISEFTVSQFREINQAIWSGKAKEERHQIYIKAMTTGLDRLPSYKGTVIRYTSLPVAVLEAHRVGEIVTYDAFTSTSKRPDWSWVGSHRFVIYSAKKGKSVEAFSINPQEQEVLFPPNTKFKVLSRERKTENPDKVLYNFVLAEVDDEGNVIGEPVPDPGK